MIFRLLVSGAVLTFIGLQTCEGHPSPQPIIGILLETVDGNYRSCFGQYKVLTFYRSFVEQGGAGAVPIFVNQSDEYYDQLMTRINGVLLPGGGVNLLTSPYGKAAYKLFKLAKKMNDVGKYFPIWGTCLGMQEMTTWPFTPRENLIGVCYGTEKVGLPLNFTSAANKSRLYGSMPDFLREILSKENITPNFHHHCLTEMTYSSQRELTDFYSVLSTNLDGKGVEFVSTFEARQYPFYGTQFHPEKMNFGHPIGYKVNQSLHAAIAGQYFGNFFVEESKRNSNSFQSIPEETRFMFGSYQTMFSEYYQYYCFNDSDVPKFDS
ncbi:gamma-glutamyl hydrolase-like [Watersipora subatra]|uniref:gamma-glutamyl hydrolase-like n=1 Tax=Watersipora subatra TaxID=2589382 RepID=UPI00355C5C2D